MSALTDLFSAMANKIRSKTGTATTYTPSEMVSDGIDDVYDAGVASATTPITPSNSSPASMTANTGYKPTANGYAIESYSSITPSNSSPVSLAANTMVKPLTIGQAILGYTDLTPSNTNPVQLPLLPPPNQPPIYRLRASGFAIQDYNSITPSDASPVSLSSGSFYKMGGSGYAIASYSSKTPSDTSPASVSSGAIVKASSAGYLYKTLQTLTETTLWTNSSPTSTFAGQTVTLSQSSANFTYIKVYFRCTTSDSTTYDSGLIDIADYDASTGSSSAPRFVMAVAMTNAFARMFNKATNTTLTFGQARQWSQSTNVNTYCVPTKVVGVK